jgi:hypothetical protein
MKRDTALKSALSLTLALMLFSLATTPVAAQGVADAGRLPDGPHSATAPGAPVPA